MLCCWSSVRQNYSEWFVCWVLCLFEYLVARQLQFAKIKVCFLSVVFRVITVCGSSISVNFIFVQFLYFNDFFSLFLWSLWAVNVRFTSFPSFWSLPFFTYFFIVLYIFYIFCCVLCRSQWLFGVFLFLLNWWSISLHDLSPCMLLNNRTFLEWERYSHNNTMNQTEICSWCWT